MRFIRHRLFPALAFAAIGLLTAGNAPAQDKKTGEVDPGGAKKASPGTDDPQPGKSSTTGSKKSSKTGTTTAKKKKPINPKRIRVFLMDGSVIAGELSVEKLTVTTDFGKLVVPVTKIISITPGLDSHTKLSAQIDKLIKQLGGPDYKSREEAQKALLAMGPQVSDVVAEHTNSKNAELKRRATEIVAKLNEMSGGDSFFDDEEDNSKKPWVKHDIVVTENFTIAGKVTPNAFEVASKYGPLKVSLNDIRRTEKEFTAKEAIVKNVSVPGQKLIQRGLKTTRIRVQAGDTVSITATGRITMSPWGSSSTSGPEGNSRYSYYYAQVNGVRTRLYGGTLVARIGGSGDFIKVGTRTKFKAKKSGTLQFGIAMNNSYISTSYYYGGDYKLRVKVDPK